MTAPLGIADEARDALEALAERHPPGVFDEVTASNVPLKHNAREGYRVWTDDALG